MVDAGAADHHPRARGDQLRRGGSRRGRAGVRYECGADDDGGGGYAV